MFRPMYRALYRENMWKSMFNYDASYYPADNMLVWWDASDDGTISLTGNDVTLWQDKSGNGVHLSQITLSEAMEVGQATQNGLQTITPVDAAGWMYHATRANTNFLHNGTNYTVYIAAKCPTLSNNNRIIYTTASGSTQTGVWHSFDDRGGASLVDGFYLNVWDSAGADPLSWKLNNVLTYNSFGIFVFSFEWSSPDGTGVHTTNGVQDGTETDSGGAVNAGDSTFQFNLGGYAVGSGSCQDVNFGEILIYEGVNTGVSGTDVIVDLMKSKWGVS